MATTAITATQGGSTANGISVHVRFLSGYSGAVGGTATQTGAAAHEASVTTTVTGSRAYMAAVDFANTAFTADANTTRIGQVGDATNAREYTGGQATASTGTPGATTFGFTAPADGGGLAVAELLPAVPGTAGSDLGGSNTVNALGNTHVTASGFEAPYGCLIVVMVASNGGAAQTTMTVTDTLGLAWTEAAHSNTAGAGYAGVWIALAPQAPVLPWNPGGTWRRLFRHPQQLPPPAAAAPVVSGPPVYPLGHPAQARQLPQRGGTVTRRAGTFGQAGPPVKAASGPVRARVPQPLRGGQAVSRAGAFGGVGAAVKALASAVAGKLRGLPARGRTTARTGPYGQLGPPVKVPSGPVQARQLPRRGGTAQGRAGTFTAAAPPPPAPVYPLGHPVQARRQPFQGGRVVRRAGAYAGTGAPAVPLRQPVSAARRPLPPKGRAASLTGPYSGTGPPSIPLRRPVRGQPQRPLLTGRAAWRSGTFTAPLVAPFTIGALTASEAPVTTLGAGAAGNVLTAATAASGALTAGTQKTGGPG